METLWRGRRGVRRTASQISPGLEIHLGYWLRLVSNEVSRAFAHALQKRNISITEWVAMNQLAAATELTPARLAETMGMTRGAISKILEKLESKRFISRSSSPLDSRVKLLSLTERARRILPQLTSIADGNDSRFFSALNSREKAALRNLLRKLAGVHQMTRIPVE